MPTLEPLGRSILALGVILVVLGLLLSFGPSLPGLFGWIGKLPGDISMKKENFHFYFPITSSILLSVVLSLVVWIISHYKGR